MKFIFIIRSRPEPDPYMPSFRIRLLVVLLGLITSACSSNDETESGTLIIYSGRSADSVEALITQFEAESGIDVEVRWDKTGPLAERLAAEGPQTSADIFFAQDAGYLGALAQAGILGPLPSGIADLVPSGFTGAGNHWVATSGRMRVLVYSPERIDRSQLPKTLAELSTTTARVGWAPTNSSYQAHISALRSIWGDEQTRTWLREMSTLSPQVYKKNSPQVEAVHNGEIDIGWVNHYYLHRSRAANPSLKAENYHFPTEGDAGNLMMLSGIAVTAETDQPDSAEAFIRFLLSTTGQNWFTQKGYEYPIVEGIERHADLPEATAGRAVVNQEVLSDVMGTRTLLDELDIKSQ